MSIHARQIVVCWLRNMRRLSDVLIIVIGVLSQGASIVPVGVTSQIVGKFKNLDECKAAAKQPHAAGPVADITVVTTWGANWYCTYSGPN